MQYFAALRMGQKRVHVAREYLNKLTDNKAMPALALLDNKTNVWEPVGEENLYAFVDESSGFVLTDTSGYILALCDKNGISKAHFYHIEQEYNHWYRLKQNQKIHQQKHRGFLPQLAPTHLFYYQAKPMQALLCYQLIC